MNTDPIDRTLTNDELYRKYRFSDSPLIQLLVSRMGELMDEVTDTNKKLLKLRERGK